MVCSGRFRPAYRTVNSKRRIRGFLVNCWIAGGVDVSSCFPFHSTFQPRVRPCAASESTEKPLGFTPPFRSGASALVAIEADQAGRHEREKQSNDDVVPGECGVHGVLELRTVRSRKWRAVKGLSAPASRVDNTWKGVTYASEGPRKPWKNKRTNRGEKEEAPGRFTSASSTAST
jgi:hypothetical protein